MTGLSNSQMIAEIKAAIADGTLPYAEMKRRLNAATDTELSKTTEAADLELVQACQGLLWEIHSHDVAYEGNQDQSLAHAKAKLNKRLKTQSIRKYVLRTGAVAAAILLIAFAAEVLMHKEWLGGSSTVDEQDYLIKGNAQDPQTVQKGTASVDEEYTEIKSTDFSEAISILSFTPVLPNQLPKGCDVLRYHALVSGPEEKFAATYKISGSDTRITYDIYRFGDINSAAFYVEQNTSGTKTALSNGQEVYLGMNLELSTCIWTKDTMVFSVIGPLTQEDILLMIESIESE